DRGDRGRSRGRGTDAMGGRRVDPDRAGARRRTASEAPAVRGLPRL
ncbi:MAG: hypothetical protein AVDCRST_MAG19-2019, partial [uncultured Thermomicrobiales bacterium]